MDCCLSVTFYSFNSSLFPVFLSPDFISCVTSVIIPSSHISLTWIIPSVLSRLLSYFTSFLFFQQYHPYLCLSFISKFNYSIMLKFMIFHDNLADTIPSIRHIAHNIIISLFCILTNSTLQPYHQANIRFEMLMIFGHRQ